MEFAFQKTSVWQFGQVLRHSNATIFQLEQFHMLSGLLSAQDQPKGSGFTWLGIMLFEPSLIEFHLAFIGSLKFTEFQVDCDQASQSPVVEQQVDVIVFVVDRDPFLASDEGKIGT